MSYLLEALRKSERERQEQSAVPSLQTPTVEWEGRDDNRGRSPWLMVAVIAICLNTLLLAVLVWRFGFAEQESSASASAPNTTTTPTTTGVSASTNTVAQPAMPAVIVVQQPRETAPAIVVRERTPETLSSTPGRTMSTNAAIDRNRAVNSRSTPASAGGVSDDGDQPQRTNQPLREVKRSAPDVQTVTSDTPPPNVNALPMDIRQQLPMLAMNSHIYASNARDSFVMINGASLNPGDEISAGLRLVAVVPEGAVLDFHGQRFLLPALSSFSP